MLKQLKNNSKKYLKPIQFYKIKNKEMCMISTAKKGCKDSNKDIKVELLKIDITGNNKDLNGIMIFTTLIMRIMNNNIMINSNLEEIKNHNIKIIIIIEEEVILSKLL